MIRSLAFRVILEAIPFARWQRHRIAGTPWGAQAEESGGGEFNRESTK